MHTCTDIYTYTHICTHTHMYVYISPIARWLPSFRTKLVCVYVCIHSYIHMYIHTRVCVCMHNTNRPHTVPHPSTPNIRPLYVHPQQTPPRTARAASGPCLQYKTKHNSFSRFLSLSRNASGPCSQLQQKQSGCSLLSPAVGWKKMFSLLLFLGLKKRFFSLMLCSIPERASFGSLNAIQNLEGKKEWLLRSFSRCFGSIWR